jgi:hypothetical protein
MEDTCGKVSPGLRLWRLLLLPRWLRRLRLRLRDSPCATPLVVTHWSSSSSGH